MKTVFVLGGILLFASIYFLNNSSIGLGSETVLDGETTIFTLVENRNSVTTTTTTTKTVGSSMEEFQDF